MKKQRFMVSCMGCNAETFKDNYSEYIIAEYPDYMDNVTMHTVEHMFATYIRNSEISENVVYFGPMGCQTGFYLLIDGIDDDKVFDLTRDILIKIIEHNGPVFGASEIECGNYKTPELEKAKEECRKYAKVLNTFKRGDYTYGGNKQ